MKRKQMREKNESNDSEPAEKQPNLSKPSLRKLIKLKKMLSPDEMEETGRVKKRNVAMDARPITSHDRSLNLYQRSTERLNAARFRHLNETLYKSSGTEARRLFASDPQAYADYQKGYKSQVEKWPINPLDLIIQELRT